MKSLKEKEPTVLYPKVRKKETQTAQQPARNVRNQTAKLVPQTSYRAYVSPKAPAKTALG